MAERHLPTRSGKPLLYPLSYGGPGGSVAPRLAGDTGALTSVLETQPPRFTSDEVAYIAEISNLGEAAEVLEQNRQARAWAVEKSESHAEACE